MESFLQADFAKNGSSSAELIRGDDFALYRARLWYSDCDPPRMHVAREAGMALVDENREKPKRLGR